MPAKALKSQALRRRCDPAKLRFKTTAELTTLPEVLGQARAVEALKFGVGIQSDGFNLFALGPSALGKHATVRQYLESVAATKQTPDDWCYVNNFDDSHRPRAVRLPAGMGVKLHRDAEGLVEELHTAVTSVFESDEYRTRRQAIDEEFQERQSGAFEGLQKRAGEQHVALVRTPVGLALTPMKDGEVMSPEVFQALPEGERSGIEGAIQHFQKELQTTVRQIPQWDKERREKIRDVNREVTDFAVGHLIDALRDTYKALPDVIAHLDAIQADVIDNVGAFFPPPQPEGGTAGAAPPTPFAGGADRAAGLLRRYQVNVVVDNSQTSGAPVIYEDNPAHGNLIGRVEHLAQMGALITDFGLIQSGALHRANGGYLTVDARKLLMQPHAYEALKRALQAGEVRIESPGQMYSMVSTVSLEPEPIPLDIKVVLVGNRMLYYMLSAHDPDFGELFKVEVDFEEDMDRRAGSTQSYARLIATLAHKHKLRDLDATGVARIIDHSARLAGDSSKLTTRMGLIADVLREADYWASEAGHKVVTGEDVKRAIDARTYRGDRMRERSQEIIRQGTVLIDTDGAKMGQVNGLAVLSIGTTSFGKPSRITARLHMGTGGVIDIERKSDLGGSLHSKGVLILSSYLSSHYAHNHPLSLSASLVFEQSYGGVDGDSASSTELYALLSALAERRLMQLAELSCAREVRFASARAKPMRATTIGRHLRAQEAAAQRALASAAGGRRVSWSFRVTRGQITSVLTEESPEVGLVFVSRTAGRPERHLYRPRISEEGGRPRRRIAHTETPVVIAYDRSALSDRALEVAGRIARAAPVTVLVPAEDAVEASTAARHRLANRPVPDHVMPVAAGDFASLRTAIGIAGSDLLVLPCDSRLLGERSVDDLVDVLRVPVVLVRQEA